MVFASLVLCHVPLTLEILCTFDTMELAEAGLVFVRDKRLQLCEPLGAAEVGMDLVEVAV